MVRTVLSLYDGAKTKVRVRSAYSEEFEVKVGVHQGSVLSPLLFAIVVDVITEKAKRSVVNELLYADVLTFLLLFSCFHERNHGRLKGKTLKSEGCTGKQKFKGQHQKNNSDGKWVRRRTI